MAENPRIAELRRRVDKDPTSIAFAQLAEEYRRTGDYQQAVQVCREGLARHRGYLSAQVTLGRALMELGQYDEARGELEAVLRVAPDNLAAIRALADIHQRHGHVGEALQLLQSQPQPAPPPLEMPPLEIHEPVDLSLDATMPTFAEAIEQTDPAPITFDVPENADPPIGREALSLEALDALSLDLPPMPDMANWTLDTDLALHLPAPAFDEPAIDTLETTLAAGGGAQAPALKELEQWLAAIVADRSPSR